MSETPQNGFIIRWHEGVVSVTVVAPGDDGMAVSMQSLLTPEGAIQLAKALVSASASASGILEDVEE